MKVRSLLLPLIVAATSALQAQAPAPPVAPVGEPIDPKALDALKEKIGQVVAVEGIVVKAGENRTGTIRYLNFTQNYKESISLVFFASKAPEEFTKEKLEAWLNKKVRATGKVSEFNGQLQITIEKWDQVVEAP
jgi:DNA/RNA endonuclease YhcR with UshA esterase domain